MMAAASVPALLPGGTKSTASAPTPPPLCGCGAQCAVLVASSSSATKRYWTCPQTPRCPGSSLRRVPDPCGAPPPPPHRTASAPAPAPAPAPRAALRSISNGGRRGNLAGSSSAPGCSSSAPELELLVQLSKAGPTIRAPVPNIRRPSRAGRAAGPPSAGLPAGEKQAVLAAMVGSKPCHDQSPLLLTALATALLPHQNAGVRWMVSREAAGADICRGGILADEMGLGKTMQVRSLYLRACLHGLSPQLSQQLHHRATRAVRRCSG